MVPVSQFEYVSTKWYTRCSNVCPPIVIPRSVICVKSDAHTRPGLCFWPKYTSCAGPSVTRHSLIRRCNVRICPSLNRPGYSRCSHSKRVLASRPGFSWICCCTALHTSPNGSSRVLHGRSFFSSLGKRSSPTYRRAVVGSIPAFAAAISLFFSVFDNFLSLLTCSSVTIPRRRRSAVLDGHISCRRAGVLIVVSQEI